MFSIHHPLLVLSAIACLVAGIDNKEGLTYLKTQEGLDYLASNAAKHGVTTTASGLQYSVLNHGEIGGDVVGCPPGCVWCPTPHLLPFPSHPLSHPLSLPLSIAPVASDLQYTVLNQGEK